MADRVVARLIYADVIEADAATVQDLRQEDSKLWEGQTGKQELSTAEVRADTIYVKTMHAASLQPLFRPRVRELAMHGQPIRTASSAT